MVKTLKHFVDRHVIGMIYLEFHAKFFAKMFESCYLVTIITMHKITHLYVLIGGPI